MGQVKLELVEISKKEKMKIDISQVISVSKESFSICIAIIESNHCFILIL